MAAFIDEDDELRGEVMPHERDNGNRLVWAAITVLGLIVLGYAGWLGVAVTNLQQEVAALTARLDIVLTDRSRHDDRP